MISAKVGLRSFLEKGKVNKSLSKPIQIAEEQ